MRTVAERIVSFHNCLLHGRSISRLAKVVDKAIPGRAILPPQVFPPTVLANIREGGRDRRILPPSQGIETSVILPSNELEISKMPDLDWALVMISEEQNHKPSRYMSTDDVPRPFFFSEVARRHPGNEREILVICPMQNPKRGILLPGISFIGGINRPGVCEVWNLAFPGVQGKL